MSTIISPQNATSDRTQEVAISDSQTRTSWLQWMYAGICSATHWIFGLISLLFLLSIAATLPVIQFLSLGYLIEATGRVVRSRKIRNGFMGIDLAARMGSIALGAAACILPIRALSSLRNSSFLLNGDDSRTRILGIVLLLAATMTLIHIAWAILRGGKLRHFMWPAPLKLWRRIRQGHFYEEASHRLLAWVQRLHFAKLFGLGWRGFLGASIYLFIPVSMMALAPMIGEEEPATIMAFAGGLFLSVAWVYIPFAQAELAVSGKFLSQFRIRKIRQQFRHAPIAHWIALLLVLILALPLYILKAELIPREAAWLPSLVFVSFMFPARLATGWAVARATRQQQPRHWILRWLAWFGLLPIAGLYALVVYATQFTSWYGATSLYEQHAFMLPVPFLGY